MTNDTRTPEEIEREIERERAGLTSTINDLQERLSFDGVVRQIGDQFRDNGGEFSRAVGRSVRENPLALAVTGIGLAWLIFGNKSNDPSAHRAQTRVEDHRDREPEAKYDYSVTGSSYPADPVKSPSAHSDRFNSGFARTPRYSTTPSWAREHDRLLGPDGRSLGERASEAGSSFASGANSAGRSVSNGVSRAGSAVSGAVQSAGSAVSGAAQSAGSAVSGAAQSAGSAASSTVRSAGESAAAMGRSVRDGVSSAAGSVAETARSGRESVAAGAAALRERLSEGTEHLSEEARDRVIAARRRAIAARQEAERAFRRSTAKASEFYEEQPMVAGLLAMAAGAAVAGALPRTRYEDDHLGAYSDHLMDEAEAILREEAEKARKVAEKVGEEAGKIVRETKEDLDRGAPGEKSAVEAIADKIKQDGKRIASAAKSEAETQDLGKAKA